MKQTGKEGKKKISGRTRRRDEEADKLDILYKRER